MMRSSQMVLLLILAWTIGGCSDDTKTRLPDPSLEGMEQSVAQQIRTAREEAEAALADGSIASRERAGRVGRLGMLYQVYDLVDAAERCYVVAESVDPGEIRWPYYRAIALTATGRFDQATRALSRTLALRADYLPAWLRLGELALSQGDVEGARNHFASALETAPDSAAARVGLGQVAAETGDPRQAIRWYEEALEIAPTADRIHYLLGLAYRSAGRDGEAAAMLAEIGDAPAPIEDPLLKELAGLAGGPWFHLARGQRMRDAGRPGDAADDFREVVRLDPTNARAHFELATVLRQLGQFEEAALEFSRSVRLAPDRPNAYLGEALCLIRLHRWRDARIRLETAYATFPGEPEILHTLIRLLAAAPDDSVRDGARALELAERLGAEAATPARLPAMAMVAAENGLWEEALGIQDRAIEAARTAEPANRRDEEVARLQADRQRYEKRLPCREPWPDDHPWLSPPAAGPSGEARR